MTPLSQLIQEAEEKLPKPTTTEKLVKKDLDELQKNHEEIKSILTSYIKKGYEEGKAERQSNYAVHEVHGEGGKTLDGEILY